MTAVVPEQLDRRQRRRAATIDEILDVSLEVMTEHGVGGLSLGEVARRMGMRTPSLYGYFDTKNALYDALFERGARLVLEVTRAATDDLLDRAGSLEECLAADAESLVVWALEHQPYAQLLFWRPVPGFEPSERAYAPAVELVELSVDAFVQMQDRGWLRADVAADEILRDWTVVIAGVVSQQLANAPHESFDEGSFTAALPNVVAMFAEHYSPSGTTRGARGAASKRGRS